MNILKNFDPKKTVKAPRRSLWAIASLLVLALLLLSFPSLWIFVRKHPGLIGVLVAVSGEVYFDWKEEHGKNAVWKRFFMALLIVSLSYELYEASATDKEAADAATIAGYANERAANSLKKVAFLSQSNLVLESRLKDVDPFNAPINSISAIVKLTLNDGKVAAPNDELWSIFERPKEADDMQFWGDGHIGFFRGSSVSNSVYSLACKNGDFGLMTSPYVTNGAFIVDRTIVRGTLIRFHEDNEWVPEESFIPTNHVGGALIPAGVFKDVGALVLWLPETVTNLSFISGTVELKVNNLRWIFPIPSQKPKGGMVTSQFTTNSANQIEAKIWRVPVVEAIGGQHWIFDGQ